MKPLVVDDSKYGHAEKIALAMGETVDSQATYVGEVNPDLLKEYGLLFIGSPTHGGLPTEGINNLVKMTGVFEGLNVAAFDQGTAIQ